jgi:hypothetical protein
MATIPHPSLFSWHDVDAASDLYRLQLVLSALPDEELVSTLEHRRGHGRNDYPIRPTWNATIAGIVYQHPSAASLLRELRRNGELRDLCGYDPLLGEEAVPSDDAFGNFLEVVMEHHEQVAAIFHHLVDQLAVVLPSLGEKLAVDSKAIRSYGKPVTDVHKKEQADRRRDVDADWGKKTYKGMRQDGSTWEKVVRWFGYKLHLIVDSVYELPVGFELTTASANDSPRLLPLVEQMEQRHPHLVARSQELSADKGYDSKANNRVLFDEYGITPVIDKRTLWKDGEQTRALFADRVDSFIYDEHGHVFCECPVSGERRELYFDGFERDRESLKYRCPAAAYGLECAGRAACEGRTGGRAGSYGRVIRIALEHDRRIFTPIARHTAKWDKAYDRRTSVERVNSRLDRVLGFELHYIRGQKKMETRVTLALIVMLAMALGRIRANQADLMRSLTAPVRWAA